MSERENAELVSTDNGEGTLVRVRLLIFLIFRFLSFPFLISFKNKLLRFLNFLKVGMFFGSVKFVG